MEKNAFFLQAKSWLRSKLTAIGVKRMSPLFTKDYEGPEIWTPDMEHTQKAKDTVEARKVYLEKTQQ